MNTFIKGMKLFTLGAALLTSTAQAGDRVGNGGDAVLCSDQVYLLDYVEAFGTSRSQETQGSIDNIVSSMLEQTKSKDAKLYESLLKTSSVMLQGINEYESTGNPMTSTIHFTGYLSDIGDEDFYRIPEGCKVEQLIIRLDDGAVEEKEFLIRESLWNKLSNYQKAASVVHEALYLYMKKSGLKTSYVARRFNAMMMKGEIASSSDYEYLNIKAKSGIKSTTVIKNISISHIGAFSADEIDTNKTYSVWGWGDNSYYNDGIKFNSDGMISEFIPGTKTQTERVRRLNFELLEQNPLFSKIDIESPKFGTNPVLSVKLNDLGQATEITSRLGAEYKYESLILGKGSVNDTYVAKRKDLNDDFYDSAGEFVVGDTNSDLMVLRALVLTPVILAGYGPGLILHGVNNLSVNNIRVKAKLDKKFKEVYVYDAVYSRVTLKYNETGLDLKNVCKTKSAFKPFSNMIGRKYKAENCNLTFSVDRNLVIH